MIGCLQMKHVEERFGADANKEVLLMCIGVTSGVGRLIFGRVADYVEGVNKVYLQVRPRTWLCSLLI